MWELEVWVPDGTSVWEVEEVVGRGSENDTPDTEGLYIDFEFDTKTEADAAYDRLLQDGGKSWVVVRSSRDHEP